MKDIFQYNSIEAYFKATSNELNKKEKRKKVILTREWTKQFDKLRGVYFIFEKDELKYVGETGSLNGRMADLLNTKNHTLRRSIGERIFSNEKGYQKQVQNNHLFPRLKKS